MKKAIKRFLKQYGYEIHKILPPPPPPLIEKSLYSKKLTLHNTKTGNYYLPTDATGDIVANIIKNNQVWDSDVVDLAANYIKKDTAVLDVGANFGQMSVLFSDMVGESGLVHAFDADDWIFEILNMNIKANNKEDKIIPHFGAVHNIENEIMYFPVQDFEKYPTYGSYGIDYNASQGRKVTSITIDSLNIEEPISFIKIDIQGGDLQAMQGAVKTIEKNQMPILFEYEYQFEDKFNFCFQDYVDFVSSINYKFYKNLNGHDFLIIPK